MKAVLWDGNKQISGFLKLNKATLVFIFSDFAETNLNLEIPFMEIHTINYYKLYNITNEGLEIVCIDGNKNVFVVKDPVRLKRIIEKGMK